MASRSAGLLMYRFVDRELEVFLVHPGGPFFRNKDLGAWTVPKGEIEEDESPLEAARREFEEETGQVPPETGFVSVGEIRQKGGKSVVAWAFAGSFDPRSIVSQTFEIEWPPRTGKHQSFPEIDRADFFDVEHAKHKLNPAQIPFVERLAERLASAKESGAIPI